MNKTQGGHRLAERDDDLALCEVCCGGESSLPTECPGRKLTAQEECDVQAGKLDYRGRTWWRVDEPILMVLHCPACGVQHIDKPERDTHAPCPHCVAPPAAPCYDWCKAWTNPPHRSHLCAGCGFIWRPADVPTVGVEAISTRSGRDGDLAAYRAELKRFGG